MSEWAEWRLRLRCRRAILARGVYGPRSSESRNQSKKRSKLDGKQLGLQHFGEPEDAVRQTRILFFLILIIVLGLVAAVAVGYAGLSGASGRIELSSTEYSFGTVPNTRPVSHAFQVRNAGDGPLEISGVSTSCGCTTAEIGDRRLAAQETTVLTVTYDPLAHDGATGEFVRLVYLRSNDPDTPEASLTIRVTVVEP